MSRHSPAYYRLKGRLIHSGIHILSHMRLLMRWIFFSVLMGCIMGLVGVAFVYAIQWATTWREAHLWMLAFLPVGGVGIVWLYRISRDESDRGTNMVLASIRSEAKLPVQMAPLIFVSTVVTHLCGGSAGREGAALQLGGSVGSVLGRLFRMQERDKQVMILCGMAAAFSAIFRTPIAASVFAMEVVCVGAMQYPALVPCTLASLTASWVAEKLGIPVADDTAFLQDVPSLQLLPALKILLLGILCAAVSILFCILLHQTERQFHRLIPNPYLRILAASGILWLLFLLVRDPAYLGIGTESIVRALAGSAVWYAFLMKMLFTAVTLGGGFKGGEIVPSFFVGTVFGCCYGQLMGISPSLCASVGMVAIFCGVTNCPLASLLIGIEMFGFSGAPYYFLAISVSYLLSGYYGLYGEQSFRYSKFSGALVKHKTRR